MSKTFFLLFENLNTLQPKVFKTLKSVQKYKLLNTNYQVKQYNDEMSAEDALKIKNLQYKKYLNDLKYKIQLDKIKGDKQLNDNTIINSEGSQNNNSENQLNSQKKIQENTNINQKAAKTGSIQAISENYIKRSQQQLQIQKQKLLNLTPQMQKFMQYHTPILSSHKISPTSLYYGYYDGCTKRNPGPSGAGYYIKKDADVYLQGALPLGTKTNNQAQFLSFLFLLVDAYINGIRRINIYGDNKLSICVAKGQMVASSVNIVDYAQACKKMTKKFQYIRLEHINRTYNSYADRLANIGVKKKLDKKEEFGVY